MKYYSLLQIEESLLLNKIHKKQLHQASIYFRRAGHFKYAKETFIKMEDVKSLMQSLNEQGKTTYDLKINLTKACKACRDKLFC